MCRRHSRRHSNRANNNIGRRNGRRRSNSSKSSSRSLKRRNSCHSSSPSPHNSKHHSRPFHNNSNSNSNCRPRLTSRRVFYIGDSGDGNITEVANIVDDSIDADMGNGADDIDGNDYLSPTQTESGDAHMR